MTAKESTARMILKELLDEIDAGPFTVARVCAEADIDPSNVSRWKASHIEPRLSSIERLREAHDALQSKRNAALGLSPRLAGRVSAGR